MRDYGKVSPQFWIGRTGKSLRSAGAEAQLVSLYLLTNPHANMIGLYYMPLMFIAHETGLGMEGASKGLASQEQEQEQEKEQDQNTMSDSDRTGGVCSDGQKDQPAQEVPEGETGGTGEPDPVDVAFENIFWGAGLRKDAKVKARTAFRTKYRDWKKTTRGTAEEFAGMLAEDIRIRAQAQQLGFDKLLPTSYLNGERWSDEKPAEASAAGRPASDGGATGAWYAKSNDGSAEVFINQAAIDRLKRGANRP